MFGKILTTMALILTTTVSQAKTLSVEDGEYRGTGVLNSENLPLPPMKFVSVRILSEGVIKAQTRAYLFGIEVAKASANLKIKGSGEYFEVINLDDGSIAGSGRCDQRACSFTAVVMKGALTLSETWIATPGGFDVVNAYQEFEGKKASYSAKFKKLR